MDPYILFLVAIVPGIFFVYWYYSKDVYQKEPIGIVMKSFLWGAFTVIPAAFTENIIKLPGEASLQKSIIENFLLIALTEEICKFLAIRLYSYRDSHFDELMDGIVYGATVGSGFATFENIFYVMEHGFAVGIMRAILSVPGHILEGAIIGYFLARAKFRHTSGLLATIIGVSITTFFHGLFDFSISHNNGEFLYLLPLVVIALFIIVNILIKSALSFDSVQFPLAAAREKNKLSLVKSHPHLSRLIRAGSYLVGVVLVVIGVFLGLGFLIEATDPKAKQETWFILLPTVPLVIGGYFLYLAKKLKPQ